MFGARILADSISLTGHRLTTVEATFPRIILAEINTHRALSRNSASSRAIPVAKMLERVRNTPFIPDGFGRNQPGMQAGDNLSPEDQDRAEVLWLAARSQAAILAEGLMELGVHKQIANRLLEPFMWHTAIISATDWANFFALRCHPDAQPQIRVIAEMIRDAMEQSTPVEVSKGWHLPLVTGVDLYDLVNADYSISDICKISAGRCARVSYLTHDGVRDPEKDIELYNRLASSGHISPLEHVARPMTGRHGNFNGWQQLRQTIPHEDDFGKALLAR